MKDRHVTYLLIAAVVTVTAIGLARYDDPCPTTPSTGPSPGPGNGSELGMPAPATPAVSDGGVR